MPPGWEVEIPYKTQYFICDGISCDSVKNAVLGGLRYFMKYRISVYRFSFSFSVLSFALVFYKRQYLE
jgi:hypothetical protein